MQTDKIGLLQNFVQTPLIQGAAFFFKLLVALDIVINNPETQARGKAGHLPANAAGADKPESFAAKFHIHKMGGGPAAVSARFDESICFP